MKTLPATPAAKRHATEPTPTVPTPGRYSFFPDEEPTNPAIKSIWEQEMAAELKGGWGRRGR